jgi:hypothetical protein
MFDPNLVQNDFFYQTGGSMSDKEIIVFIRTYVSDLDLS